VVAPRDAALAVSLILRVDQEVGPPEQLLLVERELPHPSGTFNSQHAACDQRRSKQAARPRDARQEEAKRLATAVEQAAKFRMTSAAELRG